MKTENGFTEYEVLRWKVIDVILDITSVLSVVNLKRERERERERKRERERERERELTNTIIIVFVDISATLVWAIISNL